MALFNEILNGRFNRFAQKLFSMKGQPVVPTLATDLVLSMTLPLGAAELYLQGIDQFGISLSNVANAAGVFGLRLRNPVASNVIATIVKIRTTVTIADSLIIEIGNTSTDLISSFNAPPFDSRQSRFSSLIASGTNGATAGGSLGAGLTIDATTLVAAEKYDTITHGGQIISLAPGKALNLFGITNNVSARTNIWWTERFLEDSERT